VNTMILSGRVLMKFMRDLSVISFCDFHCSFELLAF